MHTAWKVSVFGVFLVCIFPHSDWIWRDREYLSIFSSNPEKYGPEKLQIRILLAQWKLNSIKHQISRLTCLIHIKLLMYLHERSHIELEAIYIFGQYQKGELTNKNNKQNFQNSKKDTKQNNKVEIFLGWNCSRKQWHRGHAKSLDSYQKEVYTDESCTSS